VAAEGLPWDFWTIDLRQAIRSLGEISGEELTESVVDRNLLQFLHRQVTVHGIDPSAQSRTHEMCF
jgi:hypothetical protein